jgi:CheY-like chemotaxis protein
MPRILLIEDNEMNRDMLSRRLVKRGYEVAIAVDGEQGLAMVHSEAPALVLMDMSLPGIDGWEVTRQLKAAPETRGIPVIGLTAHAMAGDRDKALAAGCDGYIEKPIDVATFVAQIQAVLPRARLAEPATPAATPSVPALQGEGSGPVILVVDDSQTNRELLSLMLTTAGFRVRVATDGASAWQALAQAPCDLVLSDLHMRGEDGLRLLARMKDDARTADIPLVFISSTSPLRQEREAAHLGGAAAFLERPIEADALQQALRRVLGPPRSDEAGTSK